MSEKYQCPVCGRYVSSAYLKDVRTARVAFFTDEEPVFEWHRIYFMVGDKCPGSLQPLVPPDTHGYYRQGFLAGRSESQEPKDNPYEAYSTGWHDWNIGYNNASEEWLLNTRLADKLLAEA